MTAGTVESEGRELIERIRSGAVPREFVVFAAQGLLPLPQEELVAVLAFLAGSEDEEIASQAATALTELPPRVVISFARDDKAEGALLDALASRSSDVSVLEAVLRNRAALDATIEKLASTVGPSLQDVIVINQERILRAPVILDALLSNPALSPDVRRRALETKEEFFLKTRPAAPVMPAQTPEDDEDLSPIADLLEKAAEAEDQGASTLPAPPESEEGEEESAWIRILNMTVSQRVQAAYKGGRTERSILVRDRNKLVCSAVVRSPRITESEVESFAGMRNVEDEVLRLIGTNREWMSKYVIMHALVRNPKAPIGVVLPMINRLTLRDLKNLAGDRNVPEAVRVSARKLYQTRTQKN